MSSVFESEYADGELAAGLAQGINVLSQNQTVTFIEYVRQVLPADGWIFWLNTGIAIEAIGSLHIAKRLEQREDETIGINRVTFTAEQPIENFNKVAPNLMYIAEVGNIKFAFSNQDNFYKRADLYHYSGDAVYPALAEQIIDNIDDLDLDDQVVSNSLPIWLTLPESSVFGLDAPTFQIYPSFLIPQDAEPPYASVHIGDGDTDGLAAAPTIGIEASHFQLCKDRVRITLYGVRNSDALDFQDYVNQFSINTGLIGMMNSPVMRDAKRVQTEVGVIAQKKIIEYEISYNQSAIKDLSRQYILQCIPQFILTAHSWDEGNIDWDQPGIDFDQPV
jgi:hypothetical protein